MEKTNRHAPPRPRLCPNTVTVFLGPIEEATSKPTEAIQERRIQVSGGGRPGAHHSVESAPTQKPRSSIRTLLLRADRAPDTNTLLKDRGLPLSALL